MKNHLFKTQTWQKGSFQKYLSNTILYFTNNILTFFLILFLIVSITPASSLSQSFSVAFKSSHASCIFSSSNVIMAFYQNTKRCEWWKSQIFLFLQKLWDSKSFHKDLTIKFTLKKKVLIHTHISTHTSTQKHQARDLRVLYQNFKTNQNILSPNPLS